MIIGLQPQFYCYTFLIYYFFFSFFSFDFFFEMACLCIFIESLPLCYIIMLPENFATEQKTHILLLRSTMKMQPQKKPAKKPNKQHI